MKQRRVEGEKGRRGEGEKLRNLPENGKISQVNNY